jgi:hypothetical protein
MPKESLLPATWKVPEVFRDRVRASVGRQRALFADGHLLLVLHEPPKADQPHRRGRLFWRSPDGTWQSNTLGSGIGALEKHLNEYADALHQLDQAEERAEMADEYFRLMRDVAPLHRASGHLYHTLQEARQLVRDDRELIVCRDQAYQIHREAELLQGDAKIGLDCAIARRAEEEAESSRKMEVAAHRLNALAAIFFPIATIATIFGMGLKSGLEETFTPWLFWLVLAGCVAGGLLLKAAIMGKPDRPRRLDPNKQLESAGRVR